MNKNSFLTFLTIIFAASFTLHVKSQTSQNDTIAFIDNYPNQSILSLNEILNAKSLMLNQPELRITSYQISYVSKGNLVTSTIESNAITDKVKTDLKNKFTGKEIYFENIKAVDKNGKKYDIAPLAIKVK